jgi:hypothetical protein
MAMMAGGAIASGRRVSRIDAARRRFTDHEVSHDRLVTS